MTAAADLACRLRLYRLPDGRGWAGDCPACNYRGAFVLREREGRAVWWCANCADDRARLAAAVLGTAPRQPAMPRARVQTDSTRLALDLWDKALPAAHSLAQRYLAGRALSVPDGEALRFLPDARHPAGTRHPCMVALVTNDAGRGVAIHRTFLAPGGAGKATLDPPRMTLGPMRGGVARLCRWSPGLPLVIGEGIETSLSAGALLGMPAWAALSAGNLARVPLPDGLRALLIAADADPVGQRHAWAAAHSFTASGPRVEVLTPDAPGTDFNDLLQRHRAQEVSHA